VSGGATEIIYNKRLQIKTGNSLKPLPVFYQSSLSKTHNS